jgi:hypothetical protein
VVQVVLIIVAATLSPLIGLGLLLWLAHLEDTLPRDVRRASTKPAPEPILAIPVRAPTTEMTTIPEQRAAPEAEVVASPTVAP